MLFLALDQDGFNRRVVALPWLAYMNPGMDWEWLTRNAKLNDRQNRLGFALDLSEEVAEKAGNASGRKSLAQNKARIERSRLAREDAVRISHDLSTEVRFVIRRQLGWVTDS